LSTALVATQFIRSDYQSHSDYRRAIKLHLRAVLKGKCVKNNNTGISIRFNNVGIDKMISTIGDVKATCCCNLQLILKNGVLSEIADDRKNRPDIESFMLFKTKVLVDGNEYEVWTYIRKRDEGYFLYSLNIDANIDV
jgi:hypothetical protein